jgi:TonB family protein
MTATLRIALLAALAAAFIPAVATGQDTSTASLLRRIELLESSNTDLERRVRELESLIKSKPSKGRAITTSARWQDLASWRQLRLGMTMDEVRELLGEPERVDGGLLTIWYWADANVDFRSDELAGWSEPSNVLGGVLGNAEVGLGDQPLYAGIGGVTNPELIPSSQVQPHYPEKARKEKIQGKVVLQAVIHKDGSVGDIQVLQSPGAKFGFDQSAIAAVRQWRYTPGLLNGKPVDVYFTVTVAFPEGQ